MNTVPYFSQWETPGLTLDILARGEAALADDPAWAGSGAADRAEYVRWAGHVCGMACLKMVLAAETGRIVPTLTLARACTDHGGYTDGPDGIHGLVYAPAVRMLAERFGIAAAVVTGIDDLPGLFARWRFVIASVHPDIRWPDRPAPGVGGHLVLVTAASAEAVVFHNPSGHDTASQVGATLHPDVFARFFARRGIGVGHGIGVVSAGSGPAPAG